MPLPISGRSIRRRKLKFYQPDLFDFDGHAFLLASPARRSMSRLLPRKASTRSGFSLSITGSRDLFAPPKAGPLSQWLQSGLKCARLEVVLLETRHVKAALSAMTVKTDRKDARGLAQLIRMG